MMAVIFAGPTLRPSDRLGAVFDWRPPVQRGDVYRACMAGAPAIGIVDGYFRTTPSVLHKEILFALHRGCPVYGAASMGALRASELHTFGMIGVGAVFRDFVGGRLTRDDEVAIEHGPAEIGYPALSEALVNIRYTIAGAVGQARLTQEEAAELVAIAAGMHYPRRTLERALRVHGAISPKAAAWLLGNRVDQKAEDARELVATMERDLAEGRSQPGKSTDFEETAFFAEFRASIENPLVRDFG